jgi:hypothetical protein
MSASVSQLTDKEPLVVSTNANAGIAAHLDVGRHGDDRHRRMSAAAAHCLSKSVDVFTSAYAYTDGLLALIQHAVSLTLASPSSNNVVVDRSRLVAVLSQTRAANRLMGTLNSVAWFAAISAERTAPTADAKWLRRLNLLKGRSVLAAVVVPPDLVFQRSSWCSIIRSSMPPFFTTSACSSSSPSPMSPASGAWLAPFGSLTSFAICPPTFFSFNKCVVLRLLYIFFCVPHSPDRSHLSDS